MHQDNQKDELVLLKKRVVDDPENLHNLLALADACVLQGLWTDAIEAYESAIKLDPDNADLFSDLGTLYEEIGDVQHGEKAYQRAIELHPDHSTAYLNLGYLYEEQGRVPEAIQAYESCLERTTSREENDDATKRIGALLGDKEDAADVQVAGKSFAIRAGAYLIDSVVYFAVVYAVQFAIGVALGAMLAFSGQEFTVAEEPAQCLQFMVGLARFALYFTIFEWLYGATLGKLILGMRVVKENGEPCDFGAALIRALFRYIDGFFFAIPAYASMKPPLHQRIGDKSAETIVVNANDAVIQRHHEGWLFLVAWGLYLGLDAIITMIWLLAVIR